MSCGCCQHDHDGSCHGGEAGVLHELLESLEKPWALVLAACALALSAFFAFVPWGRAHAPCPAWVFALPAVLLCAPPIAVPALHGLFHRFHVSSDLLVTIAIAASLALGDVFAAGEVAFIMALGEWLEERTLARSRRGLEKLVSLVPLRARRVAADGSAEEVDAAEVCTGDRLRVLPGEAFPADGTVVEGSTSVDQAALTGESLPVDKAVGDTVWCGTANRLGAVDFEVSAAPESSAFRKMARLAEEAARSRAPIQGAADRWAAWLVPASLALAIVVGLVGHAIGLEDALTRAVTILVVFCPCALVLATPTAIMAAVGNASEHGALVKTAAAMERFGRVSRIAFDKTGTLTEGRLRVAGSTLSPEDLALVAAAESRSEHPFAKAIAEFAKEPSPALSVTDFRAVPGRGIEATVDGRRVRVGTAETAGAELPAAVGAFVDEARRAGMATLVAVIDGRVAGAASLSDSLRAGAPGAVAELRALGIEPALLSGDHPTAAAHMGGKAGIADARGGLFPEQKVAALRAMRNDGDLVAMVGDGVNDTPSLAAADVGIAMASLGSDAAVESADIALVGDDLARLPYLRRLSAATVRTIHCGIVLAMTINAVAVLLAVAGWLGPVGGALVHNAGSVFVIGLAALLYDRNFESPSPAPAESH